MNKKKTLDDEKVTLSVQKINKLKVVPLTSKGNIQKPFKGEAMFPNGYCNIAILARKNSGKSTLIMNILKKCCRKDETTVVVYSNTVLKDPVWVEMKKYCKSKGIGFHGATEIGFTDANGTKHDSLHDLMKKYREVGDEKVLDSDASDSGEDITDTEEEPISDEEEQSRKFVSGNLPTDHMKKHHVQEVETSKKVEYPTYAPQLFMVFDDLSADLKRSSLANFCRQSRHFRAMSIYSSQAVVDLLPSFRKQMDYYILMGGMREKDLERVHNDAGLAVPLDVFLRMYALATEKKYSFLYVDCRNDSFRINFDKKINFRSSNKDFNAKTE